MGVKDTGWGNVSGWYEAHLKGDDTYHAKVVAPNLMRLVGPKEGMSILDLACGEGYFTRLMHAGGATVTGADIAKELIIAAKKQTPDIAYHVANAESLTFANNGSYDAVTCVLALQNMADISKVFKEVARVLKTGGKLVFVLNHPAFRIPESTSWEYDEKRKAQYRRVDAYLSPSKHAIVMNPGSSKKEVTLSFHRSIQDFSKALSKAGFAITKIEEWISHRTSETGPRKEAEDTARKEIPLFMCVEAKKV